MQNENETLSAKINEFVQKNRKVIFIAAIAVVVLLAGFIAALTIMDIQRTGAISAVEELGSRYEELQPSINEEYSSLDVEELLADLEAFTRKHTFVASGYAGGRAWSIIARIHGDRNNWAMAEAAWESAAKAAKNTYLAPVAFFNAGAAAEEQGRAAEAIEYYMGSLAAVSDFPLAPRAQFAIGRLQESLGEQEAAISAYRALIANWSFDQLWTNLARSRIIVLESGEE